jgi:hypothetical protein
VLVLTRGHTVLWSAVTTVVATYALQRLFSENQRS